MYNERLLEKSLECERLAYRYPLPRNRNKTKLFHSGMTNVIDHVYSRSKSI